MPDYLAFERLTQELTSFSSLGIRPGLERVSRLLRILGDPQRSFPAIHVLGTNGKGSTAVSIESICRASGLRTALYTSPHLVSLNERLRISGVELSIESWRGAFERVKDVVGGDGELSAGRPTFFETFTALCFLLIAEAGVDVAVVEAGMGGRFDATSAANIVATVITPIAMDHMEYLGDTLEAIAGEKFAAIREGGPVFYAPGDARLDPLFDDACKEKGAPGSRLGALVEVRNIRLSLSGTCFDYFSPGWVMEDLRTPLIGAHQAANAANAASVLGKLCQRGDSLFQGIDAGAIRDGLADVEWPGRFEPMRSQGNRLFILDGAHNPHGMRTLVDTTHALQCTVSGVVFAVMREKNTDEMLSILSELRVPLYCTTLPFPRALAAEEAAESAKIAGVEVAGVFADPMAAFDCAIARTAPSEMLLCCGSLFLVGHLRGRATGDVPR